MKSMNLLVYKPEDGTIENRAQDYGTAWMTAVEILDDDTYLGAENSYNLFTVRKNSDAASDEDRRRLQVPPFPICDFNIGTFFFLQGSIFHSRLDLTVRSQQTKQNAMYRFVIKRSGQQQDFLLSQVLINAAVAESHHVLYTVLLLG